MWLFILAIVAVFVVVALLISVSQLRKRVEDLEIVMDDSVRKDHLAVLIRNHIAGIVDEHEEEKQ